MDIDECDAKVKSTKTVFAKDCIKCDEHRYFFPCNDISKGIVARACAYMYIMYPKVYDLRNQILDIELLKKWNNLHHPTQYEKERNLLVYDWQRNKNEFTDNPELIYKFF
jgi:endonuclease I